MNGSDPFEEKLKRQPLRLVPAEWREEILTVAGGTAIGGRERERSESWKERLINILWPHPLAWGGLAAIWLIIIGLNAASSDPVGARVVRATSPPSSEQRQLLHEQEQLLAELIGPAEKSAVVEPKRRSTQPRSAARPQFLNV